MMKREIKYSEILKAINGFEGGEKIIVIRNTTLEPVLGDYFRFYDPSTAVEYMDIYPYLSSKASGERAVVLLNLAELSPDFFEHFFMLDAAAINENMARLKEMLKILMKKLSGEFANVCFFTFELDFYTCLPNERFSYNNFAKSMNDFVAALVKKYTGIQLIDINSVIARIGAEHFYDRRGWYATRTLYSISACNALAYETAKRLSKRKGQTKKCLILDCDNVLWGGIVSEDGMSRIQLSRQYQGSAYRDFQREVLRLYHEGILICVCSKNDESDVLEVFDSHPDMLLKREHIATYRINWKNKSDNIGEIAEELGISLEDMVFLDDSEYETGLVSKTLKQVTVICLDSKKPYTYADCLKQCDFFQNEFVTEEAMKRGRMYQEQAERKHQKKNYVDLEEYHESLQTKTQIASADEFSLPRIAELSQRTNQFNLSARRYTIEELKMVKASKEHELIFLRASDLFGDMGIVCAAIVCYKEKDAVIEAFWLSCRVFGRGFEIEMLTDIKQRIRRRGIVDLYGVYQKSMKNHRHQDFYQENGVALWK